MQNDIAVSVIGLVFCLYLTIRLFSNFQKVFDDYEYFRNENKRVGSWKRIKAKVLKKGFNLDYIYEDATFSELKNFIGDISEEEFIRNQKIALDYDLICGGPMIYYGYIIDGEKYFSREIGMFPSNNDVSLFYSLKVGDVIDVLVNPEDHSECFLRTTTEEDLSSYEWKTCKRILPKLAFLIITWALLFYGIYEFIKT